MSDRQVTEPVLNSRNNEEHPAFGMIRAGRISSNPSSVLFGSDIRHQHSIVIQVSTATRKRDLNRDWTFADREVLEVELSETQWAEFVSSVGSSGVSCTLRSREGQLVDGLPYAPRTAESLREVDGAAQEVFGKIQEALATYEAHKTAANFRNLRSAVENAAGNLEYVAKSMSEHVEGVVQRARADIETMVVKKAAQLGIEPAEVDKDVRELLA